MGVLIFLVVVFGSLVLAAMYRSALRTRRAKKLRRQQRWLWRK